MVAIWKDVTSRRQGESQDSEPRTVEATFAWARASVTRHINNPGVWHLFAPDIGVHQHRELKATALEDAKREAEAIICTRVAELAMAVGKVLP